eukprot:10962561-Karenia_brevis.AAC.1
MMLIFATLRVHQQYHNIAQEPILLIFATLRVHRPMTQHSSRTGSATGVTQMSPPLFWPTPTGRGFATAVTQKR